MPVAAYNTQALVPSAHSSRTSQHKEVPNLDVMRAIAVSLVVVSHVFELVGRQVHLGNAPAILGGAGVLVFFVHTSLVLMMSLDRARIDGWRLFSSFYIRRCFRIYPLAAVTVAGVLVFDIPPVAWAVRTPEWDWPTVVSNFALAQNLVGTLSVLGPLWSLPYELQMYVFIPWLFVLGRVAGFLRIGIAAVVVTVILAIIHSYALGNWPLLKVLDLAQYAPCFAAGVLAFALVARYQPHIPAWLWAPTLGTCVGLFTAVVASGVTSNIAWPRWLFCLIIALLLPLFEQLRHRPAQVLCHVIAKYSYGIYLFHLVALWFAFTYLATWTTPAQIVVFLFLLTTLPVLGHHLIEAPLIRVGVSAAARVAAIPIVNVSDDETISDGAVHGVPGDRSKPGDPAGGIAPAAAGTVLRGAELEKPVTFLRAWARKNCSTSGERR